MASNIRRSAGMTFEPANQSQEKPNKRFGDRLTRNAAIATLLLLAMVGLRESGPQGKNILQTIQDTVESQWDQNVGKLTYVSNTLADSIQVFGHTSFADERMLSPVLADAVQAWSAESPYLLYENAGNVFAAAKGEVIQIAHDDDSEYIIRLSHENGLNTIYYGLSSCLVQEGDCVQAETVLGASGQVFAFEIQKNGKLIDASNLLDIRETAE